MRNNELSRFVSELNNLCEFLDYKYNINKGGCCFVAYEIAKHLDKLNIKYNLVVSDFIRKNEDKITREVKNKAKNFNCIDSVVGNFTCDHYYLYIKNVGYINPNVINNNNYYFISDINSQHIKWIYDKSTWNDIFRISDKDYIKSFIKTFFESCFVQLK